MRNVNGNEKDPRRERQREKERGCGGAEKYAVVFALRNVMKRSTDHLRRAEKEETRKTNSEIDPVYGRQ